MGERSAIQSIRRHCRRHRRSLYALYWVAMVLFVVLLVVPSLRTRLLYRLEHATLRWDDRWARRVDYGEQLVAAGHHERSIGYLEHLDRRFPAQQIQHKRDKQRERILDALGRSYAALGRKRLSLGIYRRLVAFDPRNYANHHRLAETCALFDESDEAREHSRRVLTMHPTHLPSLRREVSYHFDRGDFAEVVNTYETYLDAFVIHYLSVSLGDASVEIATAVDGRFHELEARIARPPGWFGSLVIDTSGSSIGVTSVTLRPPIIMGRAGTHAPFVVSGAGTWSSQDFDAVANGQFRTVGPKSALTLQVPAQTHGVATVRLRVRLFKTHDAKVWRMVHASYRARVDSEGLEAAQSRMLDAERLDT